MSLLEELLNGPTAADQYLSMLPMLQGSPLAGGSAAPSDPYSGGGKLNGWINQALDITNSPQAWADELRALALRESGGDPNARNDTPVASGQHAQGLFQTIPSTFEAHNMPRLGGINDPVANAVAAIRYIQGRYGTPMNLPSSGGY